MVKAGKRISLAMTGLFEGGFEAAGKRARDGTRSPCELLFNLLLD